MAKSKRRLRAKNKIEMPEAEGLVRAEPDVFVEVPRGEQLVRRTVVARSTLFTAELEAVIDLIARDRVYRTMLAMQRFLPAPPQKRIESRPLE